SPDGNERWIPRVAMDKMGNIAVGYSVSSSATHPSIRFAVHNAVDRPDLGLAADPLGTLEAENTVINGSGSQLPNLNRWGDYSAMSIDPVDDCTFWYTNE